MKAQITDKHLLEMMWERFPEIMKRGTEQPAQQQEPFCYFYIENGEEFFAPKNAYVPDDAKPLYTSPPAQQHDYRIKYDRPCYKCRNNFCPGNCQEPEQPPKHQKPAGYFRLREYGSALIHDQVSEDAKHNEGVFPLYTFPQSKPLTDEQIEAISDQIERSDFFECVIPFARAIEAAHGIKGDA